MDLKAYYNERVAKVGPKDYFAQVGLTVDGEAIPPAHFDALLVQISDTLALGPKDYFLDLCCGNGLFTKPLASRVELACGADLSDAVIAVASRDHAAPNLDYVTLDATKVAQLDRLEGRLFSKVLVYGAWQHFDEHTARPVLEGLSAVTSPDVRILLGFIPEQARKDNFFDTPERRAAHAAHLAAGTDVFGTWWDRDTLRTLCAEFGFTCTFQDLPAAVHAARYRFNVLLERA